MTYVNEKNTFEKLGNRTWADSVEKRYTRFKPGTEERKSTLSS